MIIESIMLASFVNNVDFDLYTTEDRYENKIDNPDLWDKILSETIKYEKVP